MQTKVFLIGMLFFLPLIGFSQSIFDEFDQFLKDHVVFGLVDYENLSQEKGQLEGLVNRIASYNLQVASSDHQTAFYINAYNFLVISQVAKNYPISSPLEVEGFFKKNKFVVAGESLTLDQIEFEKLLDKTKDPRIHFTLGCAARSCPFLFDDAFFPEKLDQQLDFRAHQIIAMSNYVYVDESKKIVQLSKIFEWYMDQFLDVSESLIKYVNQYQKKEIPPGYSVQFREYDWKLNSR